MNLIDHGSDNGLQVLAYKTTKILGPASGRAGEPGMTVAQLILPI